MILNKNSFCRLFVLANQAKISSGTSRGYSEPSKLAQYLIFTLYQSFCIDFQEKIQGLSV